VFHNYFFLRRLAAALHTSLQGLQLIEAFSQNKDELILGFASQESALYLIANLDPKICLLDIADDFKRARKNSIELFAGLRNKTVTSVKAFSYERSLAIYFGSDNVLVFKMHGSRSNVIFFKTHKTPTLFRNILKADESLSLSDFDRNLEISFDQFKSLDCNPNALIPALGKEVKSYLMDHQFASGNPEEQWQQLKALLELLENETIRIVASSKGASLTLLPTSVKVLLETSDPIEACQFLYQQVTHNQYLQENKSELTRPLVAEIKRTESYLVKTNEKLQEIIHRRGYDEIANLLMANLHVIPKSAERVVLDDFYTNSKIEIKLNPTHTVHKNAENLYRKSKNQKKEIQNLEENLNTRKEQLTKVKEKLATILATDSIRELREFNPKKTKEAPEINVPFHRYQFEGYQILVGKNAKANDVLTLKVATKNDLWLHAKDVAGSHVVVKHQAGKNFPSSVTEHAAKLAAWYSKRKTDSLCPVIVTEKKFVRKRKGDPAGAVVVEREKVILVQPENFPNQMG
jgi:predicted ribosome quality control (RQC) complex YloA/Tae2 family protein